MNNLEGNRAGNILEQIGRICREFRKQISTGKSPRLETFLAGISKEGAETLFANLLEIELRYRQSKDQRPTSDEYLKRFPQFANQVRRAFFEPTMDSDDFSRSSPADPQLPSLVLEPDSASATLDTLNAQIMGDYQLVRELGRGGMGVVYEAKHTKTGNRVALKTLPTGRDGQDLNAERLHRFRKEFRSLSEINHPNLVGMQTLEVDGVQWFFTMDLIEGEDFLSYVRPQGVLDVERLRITAGQLARGLVLLHKRRIVHRDLKPNNVLVERDGTVKILDFGLVAELQRANDQTQTRSVQFAGTPKYASPEQLFGQRSEASDWYAVGVMLYEALTGEAPFASLAPMEMLRHKQQYDAPLLQGRENLPADLTELTDGLLRREPSARLTVEAISELLQLDSATRLHGSSATAGSAGTQASAATPEDELDPSLFAEEELVLVGRETQLAQLEEARRELRQTGKPIVVWITGLSGEGKSSLCEHFLRPLRKGPEMLVLSGRCYDRESVPFKAVDCIIESLVRYLRSSAGQWLKSQPPEDVEFLVQVFPLLRRVEWIAERKIRDLARLEPQTIRGRAFYGLRQLLTAISQRTPVVIHLDDLQWADADSSQAWYELLNHTEAPALLVLGSYRSDEVEGSPFLEAWQQATTSVFHKLQSRQVSVEPLTREQCLEVAAQRTGLPRETIERQIGELFRDTGGNAYFLEQLLEGFDPVAGIFRHVPLDEIIAERLARLPEIATKLLEVVAVSGQPVRVEEASKVVGASQSSLATLTHMRSERLVRLLGGGDELLVETWHDKVRETVLKELPSGQKQALHLRLAEEIESQQANKAVDWLASLRKISTPAEYEFPLPTRLLDLCQHFSAAGDQRAFVYQWLAAEQAMQAYAVTEAYEFFQQAAAFLPNDEKNTLGYRFWMGLGRVALWNMFPNQTIKAFKEAVELARSKIDTANAYGGLQDVMVQVGKFDEAIGYLDLALDSLRAARHRSIIEQLGGIVFLGARILLIPRNWQKATTFDRQYELGVAHTLMFNMNFGLAEKHFLGSVSVNFQQLLYALRSGDQSKIALGLASFANMFCWLSLSWLAPIPLRRALNYGKTIDDKSLSARLRSMSGIAWYWNGDLEQAASQMQGSIPALRRSHQFVSLQFVTHMYRHVLSYLGDTGSELVQAQDVFELASGTGNEQGKCWGAYDVAVAFARAGDLAESVVYMQIANRALSNERFLMTPAIRASTDGFVRLQCSDYQSARLLALSAWSIVKEGAIAIDVTLFLSSNLD